MVLRIVGCFGDRVHEPAATSPEDIGTVSVRVTPGVA
jgi:hypothetical protein